MFVTRMALIATIFFCWLVAGKSLEQVLLVVEIGFCGLFLAWIGTLIAKAIEKHRYARLYRK